MRLIAGIDDQSTSDSQGLSRKSAEPFSISIGERQGVSPPRSRATVSHLKTT